MTATRRWTVAECLAQIEALEAKLVRLADVPTSGQVGRTRVDLADNPRRIEKLLKTWRARLAAARHPQGLAERPRWGC